MVFARMVVMAAVFQILFSFHAAAETLADGDSLDPNSRMGKYLYSERMFVNVHNVTAEIDRRSGFACDELYKLSPDSLTVYDPIEFPENAAHPVSGSWVYKYLAWRCGKLKQFNLLLLAVPSGEHQSLMLPSGDSLASLPVILKVIDTVEQTKAMMFGPDCDAYAYTGIEVRQAPQLANGEWTELWTAKGCGKEVDFTVVFTPGEDTTKFKIRRDFQ